MAKDLKKLGLGPVRPIRLRAPFCPANQPAGLPLIHLVLFRGRTLPIGEWKLNPTIKSTLEMYGET